MPISYCRSDMRRSLSPQFIRTALCDTGSEWEWQPHQYYNRGIHISRRVELSSGVCMYSKRPIPLYRAIVTVFIFLACLAAAPAGAQMGLGLVPMRVELKLTPGQQQSGTLRLTSEAGEKARVRAEILDFYIDETTTPQFQRLVPRESTFSCRDWLSLNPMESEVAPGGSLNVRFTIRPPQELREGGYHCAAGFTTMPPASSSPSGMGVRMAVRIVAAFYIQVGNPTIVGHLKEIKLEPLIPKKEMPGSGWQAVVVLKNEGRIYFRPAGKLEVLDSTGKVIESDDFPALPVLRDRDQRFVFPLAKLDPGHYKLRARVDIGTSDIQEGTADVEVVP